MREWQRRGKMENKEPLVLRPRVRNVVFYLALMIAIMVVFIFRYEGVMLWLGLLWSGMNTLRCVIQLLRPGSNCLVVSSQGFEIKYLLRSTEFFRWSDIKEFGVGWADSFIRLPLVPFKSVVFNYVDSCKGKYQKIELEAILRTGDELIADFTMHTYGLSPDELAGLLNKKRTEYLEIKNE
jgi:hypothetical protein